MLYTAFYTLVFCNLVELFRILEGAYGKSGGKVIEASFFSFLCGFRKSQPVADKASFTALLFFFKSLFPAVYPNL